MEEELAAGLVERGGEVEEELGLRKVKKGGVGAGKGGQVGGEVGGHVGEGAKEGGGGVGLDALDKEGSGKFVVGFGDWVRDGNAAGFGGAWFGYLDEALDEPTGGLTGGEGGLEDKGVEELGHEVGEAVEQLRRFLVGADGLVGVDTGEEGSGVDGGRKGAKGGDVGLGWRVRMGAVAVMVIVGDNGGMLGGGEGNGGVSGVQLEAEGSKAFVGG